MDETHASWMGERKRGKYKCPSSRSHDERPPWSTGLLKLGNSKRKPTDSTEINRQRRRLVFKGSRRKQNWGVNKNREREKERAMSLSKRRGGGKRAATFIREIRGESTTPNGATNEVMELNWKSESETSWRTKGKVSTGA